MGDILPRKGFPTLLEKLAEDLAVPADIDKLAICVTGDLTTQADYQEFKAAEEFVRGLAAHRVHGQPRGLESIYIVPGNHDVNYGSSEVGERWERYISLVNRVYRSNLDHSKPLETVVLHDRTGDLGALILCLNSAIYVQKGTPSERRGEIDYEQLGLVEDRLKSVPVTKLQPAIRIALVHHHPVLIPALVEADRGYDAIERSGLVLNLLRRYGFHLILHGHKHNPFVFTEDSSSAWTGSSQPIVVAAGGSVGSTGLPTNFARPSNCYNRITIKWHPSAGQTRVQIQTRGLTVFNTYGQEDHPKNWRWTTLKEEDRTFFAARCVPLPRALVYRRFDAASLGTAEEHRVREYRRARGNMPVVEVMPSLVPGQAYEARVWIVGHGRTELPIEVTWSAGPRNSMVTIHRDTDTRFCAAFDYWGPMLVQALLKFGDGETQPVHVYARLPEDCARTGGDPTNA